MMPEPLRVVSLALAGHLSVDQGLFVEECLDLGVSYRCVVSVGAYSFGTFTEVEVCPNTARCSVINPSVETLSAPSARRESNSLTQIGSLVPHANRPQAHCPIAGIRTRMCGSTNRRLEPTRPLQESAWQELNLLERGCSPLPNQSATVA